jgi:hypothetical protein
MIKYFATILSILILSGCASPAVPVVPKFPNVADEEMLQPCLNLKLTPPETTRMSDFLGIVTDNYKEYHECRQKVDDWIKWYNVQKKNFESIK